MEPHPRLPGLPQRPGKRRVGGGVGGHVAHPRHLHHKDQMGADPLPGQPGQLPQMLCPPEGGRVGEKAVAVLLQGDALDLDEMARPGGRDRSKAPRRILPY